MLNKKITLIALCYGLFSISNAYAASCEDYPNSDGVIPEMDAATGIMKIVSTASAVVPMDDMSFIKDAKTEALLEAKAQIAKYFNEDLKKSEVKNRAVNTILSSHNNSKSVDRKEVTEMVEKWSLSSQKLLSGVVQLGDCYTTGKELRVTVGVKPETIKLAETLSNSMSKSTSSQSAQSTTNPNSNNSTTNTDNSNGSEGFNHSSRLQNF